MLGWLACILLAEARARSLLLLLLLLVDLLLRRASWGSQDWQTRIGLWEICATDEALPFEETDFCYEWGDETFDENNIPFADVPTVIHMTRFFTIVAGQSRGAPSWWSSTVPRAFSYIFEWACRLCTDISSLLAIIFLSLIPLSRHYRQRPGVG